MNRIRTILLSRADSIGDVVLTLPMAGVLKEIMPEVKILFLGKDYTRDVVALSEHVDEFISYDELQKIGISEQIQFLKSKEIDCSVHVFPKQDLAILFKKTQIPIRAGTTNRLYHWFNCNKLIKLSRKNSELHEAQLNLKLIEFLGAKPAYNLKQIKSYYGFTRVPALQPEFAELIDKQKQNIILHPKSKGSAREWGLKNFDGLIKLLPEDKFKVFISGTKEEGAMVKDLLKNNPRVIDITGKMNLQQFIAFINACDGMVAASTGPLHIAAALGKKAIGLFAPMRPIHPERWAPIGEQASSLVLDKNCVDCKKTQDCVCIRSIKPEDVLSHLQ
ncbi:MAG: glycosyltransferase family 9 protein [Bacteroidia bacterium]